MPHDPRAYLWDAREAADAILGFVAGVDLDTYAAKSLLHSAVERKFEVIGEALNQLSKTDPALAARVPGLAQIVAFRNLLIHGSRSSITPGSGALFTSPYLRSVPLSWPCSTN